MPKTWKIQKFYHVVLNTRDIQKSVAFYKDLGLEVLHDRTKLNWPPIFAGLFGVRQGTTGAGVLMGVPAAPGGTMLDIIEWRGIAGDVPNPDKDERLSPRIVAFRVENIRAAYEELSAKGYRFTPGGLFNPQDVPPGGPSDFKVGNIKGSCFLYDPDGYLVELMELRPGAAHSQDDD